MRLLVFAIIGLLFQNSTLAFNKSQALSSLLKYENYLLSNKLNLKNDHFNHPLDKVFVIRYNLNSELRKKFVSRLIFLTDQNFKGMSYREFLIKNLPNIQPKVESYVSTRLQFFCEKLVNRLQNTTLDNEQLLSKIYSYLNELDIKDFNDVDQHFTPYDYIANSTGVNVETPKKTQVGLILEKKLLEIEKPQTIRLKAPLKDNL